MLGLFRITRQPYPAVRHSPCAQIDKTKTRYNLAHADTMILHICGHADILFYFHFVLFSHLFLCFNYTSLTQRSELLKQSSIMAKLWIDVTGPVSRLPDHPSSGTKVKI